MITLRYRFTIMFFLLGLGFQALGVDVRCAHTSRSLEQFIDCMEPFTIPEGYFTTDSSCRASQLTATQKLDWEKAVNALLTTECPIPPGGGEVGLNQPYVVDVPGLPGYTVTHMVTEEPGMPGGGQVAWCVLSEETAHVPEGHEAMYVSGWGFMIVPATGAKRNLHISAPHPGADSDAGTAKQALEIFGKTGARSVVVAGRHRGACTKKTDCSSATGSDTYYESDGAHDDVSLSTSAFAAT